MMGLGAALSRPNASPPSTTATCRVVSAHRTLCTDGCRASAMDASLPAAKEHFAPFPDSSEASVVPLNAENWSLRLPLSTLTHWPTAARPHWKHACQLALLMPIALA